MWHDLINQIPIANADLIINLSATIFCGWVVAIALWPAPRDY